MQESRDTLTYQAGAVRKLVHAVAINKQIDTQGGYTLTIPSSFQYASSTYVFVILAIIVALYFNKKGIRLNEHRH